MARTRTDKIDHGWYRVLPTAEWETPAFQALPRAEPCARYLLRYLQLGPHTTNLPGLFRLGILSAAEALSWTVDEMEAHAQVLERAGHLIIDRQARLMFLPGAFDLDQASSSLTVKGWRPVFRELPACELKRTAGAHLFAKLTQADRTRSARAKERGKKVEDMSLMEAGAFLAAVSNTPSHTPSHTPSLKPGVEGDSKGGLARKFNDIGSAPDTPTEGVCEGGTDTRTEPTIHHPPPNTHQDLRHGSAVARSPREAAPASKPGHTPKSEPPKPVDPRPLPDHMRRALYTAFGVDLDAILLGGKPNQAHIDKGRALDAVLVQCRQFPHERLMEAIATLPLRGDCTTKPPAYLFAMVQGGAKPPQKPATPRGNGEDYGRRPLPSIAETRANLDERNRAPRSATPPDWSNAKRTPESKNPGGT